MVGSIDSIRLGKKSVDIDHPGRFIQKKMVDGPYRLSKKKSVDGRYRPSNLQKNKKRV